MKTVISTNKELDDLLMSDTWTFEGLLPFREYSKAIIKVYMETMAEYHGLSERQMRFLANEWAEISVGTFCDTLFRLDQKNMLINEIDSNYKESDHDLALGSFINSCESLHPGTSRKYRLKYASLILQAFGANIINEDNINDPKTMCIEELLKGMAIIDPKIIGCSIAKRNVIRWAFRYIRKGLRDVFVVNRTKKPKVLIINPKKFERIIMFISGIDWLPFHWGELEADITALSDKRREMYLKLLDSFTSGAGKIKFPLNITDEVKKKLLKVLFAGLIVSASPNVLNKNILRERLNAIKQKMVGLEVDMIVGRGGVDNGLIAAAAVGLGLPIVLFQMGGGLGIIDRVEGCYEIQLEYVDHYLGLGWSRDKVGSTSLGKAELHKVSSPELFSLLKQGLNYDKKVNQGRILFSPSCFSALYRTELWSAYYPEHALSVRGEMEKLFCLLAEQDSKAYEYEIMIKLKAFSYNIFSDYQYLFGLMKYPNGMKVRYLLEGVASRYFPYVQLHILDGICTGLMTSLAYNLPTVAYWSKKSYVLTPQAKPIFEELRKHGIVGTSAEEMAVSVDKFMNHPEEWSRKGLQDVRRAYIENFARSNSGWEQEILNVLNNIAANKAKYGRCSYGEEL